MIQQSNSIKTIVSSADKLTRLEGRNILYVQAYQNYSKVYLDDGTMQLSDQSLSKMLQRLGSIFYRCHRSYIVNIERITSFKKHGILQLNHNVEVPISRRKKTDFVAVWEQFINEHQYVESL